MKKNLLSLLLLVSSITAFTQVSLTEKCGTMPSLQHRLENDARARHYLFHSQKKQTRSHSHYDTTGYIVIPVVFHVVYNPSSPAQNIPDSLIFSQIDVLNKDYSYTNAYIGTTLPEFDSLAVHTGIQFKLASVDPDGNPTTGITRTSSTSSHALTALTNSVKKDATGGKDPWPTNKYLNVWVCNMFPGLLGYAQFPGDDPLTDGVVIAYAYVGEQPGAPTAPSNLGRTSTHECGHWLGMRHVWGDGGCGVDDMVEDTPDSDAASSQDCQLTRNDCDESCQPFWHGYNPVDPVQNFMDYSADACMTMFSRGQMKRMWNKIVDHRDSLFYSMGCGNPKLNGYIVTKNVTSYTTCDGEATFYPAFGTPPYSYLWNDPMAHTTATAMGLCDGKYTVRVVDADNDTIYVDAYVNPHSVFGASLAISHATCGTCADAGLTVTAWGGTPAYTYALNGGTPQASNVFSGLLPGSYSVEVTDSCGNSITLDTMMVGVIGIDEASTIHSNDLLVYPNPAQSSITIESVNGNSIGEIQVSDASGRVIERQIINSSKQTLTIESLQKGVYFVTAKGNERVVVKRLVKE